MFFLSLTHTMKDFSNDGFKFIVEKRTSIINLLVKYIAHKLLVFDPGYYYKYSGYENRSFPP